MPVRPHARMHARTHTRTHTRAPARAHRQELWVGAATGQEAESRRERFRQLIDAGSGYRTEVSGGETWLCWPVPRRVMRQRQAHVERRIQQAPKQLEGAAEQNRAFQKAVQLATFNVTGEKHFQALGGGLLLSAEEAAQAAQEGPQQPLALATRPADLGASQASDDEGAAGSEGPQPKRSRIDTPEVQRQRVFLAAAKQLSSLDGTVKQLTGATKGLAKIMKKRTYEDTIGKE